MVFLIILGVDLAEVLVLLLECLLLVLTAVFVVVFCAVLVTGSLRAARTLPLASRREHRQQSFQTSYHPKSRANR